MSDGFPLYGPYGYASNTNTTIKLMTTGYQLRTDMATNTVRNTLMSCATGTCVTTTAPFCGPVINSTYPIGNFIQDYVWKSGYDLDLYNGRANSKTPEYPNGVYAYYLPLSASLNPIVPMIIGPTYYGAYVNPSITAIPATATTFFNYV